VSSSSKVLAVRLAPGNLWRIALFWVVLGVAACAGLSENAATSVPRATPPAVAIPAAPPARSILPNTRDSVKFLVIGDSGTGGQPQIEVAGRIAEARKVFPFTRALMLGDNLYGRNNPAAYRNKFERPYAALLEGGVKFYASLGNHDDAAQRFYAPFNMDGRRYYTHGEGDVRFFALDSTYMSPEQLQWLEQELRRSTQKWKIAYMHHPMYSSGERHGPTPPLRAALEPLFAKYGVDLVLAGHEHFYERMRPQGGIVYVIQGGAANLRRGNIRRNSAITAKGFDTDRSFTLCEIVGDQLYLETISRTGAIVDSVVITRREAAVPSSE
jgi:3',5'-cyclic AMP phosphodiesterase CpdA